MKTTLLLTVSSLAVFLGACMIGGKPNNVDPSNGTDGGAIYPITTSRSWSLTDNYDADALNTGTAGDIGFGASLCAFPDGSVTQIGSYWEASTGETSVFFRRSTDDGLTWSNVGTNSTFTYDNLFTFATGYNQHNPEGICVVDPVDGEAIVVAIADDSGTGNRLLVLLQSTDSGASWAVRSFIDTDVPGSNIESIAFRFLSDGTFVIAYNGPAYGASAVGEAISVKRFPKGQNTPASTTNFEFGAGQTVRILGSALASNGSDFLLFVTDKSSAGGATEAILTEDGATTPIPSTGTIAFSGVPNVTNYSLNTTITQVGDVFYLTVAQGQTSSGQAMIAKASLSGGNLAFSQAYAYTDSTVGGYGNIADTQFMPPILDSEGMLWSLAGASTGTFGVDNVMHSLFMNSSNGEASSLGISKQISEPFIGLFNGTEDQALFISIVSLPGTGTVLVGGAMITDGIFAASKGLLQVYRYGR